MRKLIRVSLVESTLYRMQNKGVEKIMFEEIATIFNRSVSKEEIAEVLNATPEATIEDPREIENDEDLHEIEDETDKDH